MRNFFITILPLFFIGSVFLVFSGCLSVSQTRPGSENGFLYTVNNNAVTITGWNGTAEDVVIPDVINQLPVKVILPYVFARKNIRSVTIPASVTNIGDSSFAYNKISALVFPGTLPKIARSAFMMNPLTEITLPQNLDAGELAWTPPGFPAFYQIHERGAGKYTFKDDVWYLDGKNPPPYCILSAKDNFTILAINDKNVQTGNLAYNGNYILPPGEYEIYYSNSNGSFQTLKMNMMAGNTYKIIETGIYTMSEKDGFECIFVHSESITITGWNGTAEDVTIPAAINGQPVKEIYDDAFRGKNIRSVSLPDCLESIGEGAFSNNHLTRLVLPKELVSVIYPAFDGNPITAIEVPHVLEQKDMTELNLVGLPLGFAAWYTMYGRQTGTYTLKNDIWSPAGKGPLPYGVIITAENTIVSQIDDKHGRDYQYDSQKYLIPPGKHTIGLYYSDGAYYSLSSSDYDVTVTAGKTYHVAADVRGDKIYGYSIEEK